MSWFPVGPQITLYDSEFYEAFPAAMTNPVSGTTIATWAHGGSHHTTSAGRMVRWEAGAPTWSPPIDVTAGAVQFGCLGSRWAMLTMGVNPYRGWVQTSTDDGVTWGAATAVNWGSGTGFWAFPSGLCWADDGTTDGLLLAAAYGTNGIMIAASTNAGATWTPRSSLPLYFGTDAYSEPGIVQAADGRLVLLIRQDPKDGSTPRTWGYQSTDWGITWVAKGVAIMGATSAPNPARLSDGVLIVNYRDKLRNDSHSFAVSADNGNTWVTTPLNSGWQMYGQFAPRPGGRAVLVAATQTRGALDDSWIWTQMFGVVTDMLITLTTPSFVPEDVPRVDLTITQIPAEAARLTVERLTDGQWWTVRTPGTILSGTSAYLEDHEAPVGVPITYRVTAYNTAGTVLAESTRQIDPLPDPPTGWVWLSDPLDALSARLVRCTSETDPERPLEREISDAFPLGSRFGVSSYGSQRWGELRWQVYCRDAEEHRAVADLLAGGVLIRAESWRDFPPLIYGPPRGVSQQVTPRPGDFWSLHTFAIVPSVGPGVSTILPRRVWADYMAEAATWADGMAMYPVWRDVIRGGAV